MSYKILQESITYKYHEKINKPFKDLFSYLNIVQFYYCKITNSGYLANFDSNIAWAEYFTSEKIYQSYPFFCHPEFAKEGTWLIRDVEDKSLEPAIQASRKFNYQFWLRIVRKNSEGMEEYGFHSNLSTDSQASLFLNELPLIKLFIKKYRKENEFLFSCLEESKINIAKIMGSFFYEKKGSISSDGATKKNILRKLGIKVEKPLSSKEIEVIRLLIRGYSAGKIAPKVYLAKRTVEHYIERIKEKLICQSKVELIQKIRELEEIGYLPTSQL